MMDQQAIEHFLHTRHLSHDLHDGPNRIGMAEVLNKHTDARL